MRLHASIERGRSQTILLGTIRDYWNAAVGPDARGKELSPSYRHRIVFQLARRLGLFWLARNPPAVPHRERERRRYRTTQTAADFAPGDCSTRGTTASGDASAHDGVYRNEKCLSVLLCAVSPATPSSSTFYLNYRRSDLKSDRRYQDLRVYATSLNCCYLYMGDPPAEKFFVRRDLKTAP